MKYIVGAILATLFWVAILSILPMPADKAILYDCGMAEWHPDIPKDVKEACRRMRQQNKGIST